MKKHDDFTGLVDEEFAFSSMLSIMIDCFKQGKLDLFNEMLLKISEQHGETARQGLKKFCAYVIKQLDEIDEDN